MRYCIIFFLCAFFLSACNISEIKDAAAGINKAAEKAATSITEEVHSIRAIEITHNNTIFTVNDIYKSILRDVQWHYEKEEQNNQLLITGTWKSSLFEEYGLSLTHYPTLDADGKVSIFLEVTNGAINEQATVVKVEYHDDVLLYEKGEKIQKELYQYYTEMKK